jgi:AraC-like DNA-binding protein
MQTETAPRLTYAWPLQQHSADPFLCRWQDLEFWQKFPDVPLIFRQECYGCAASSQGKRDTGSHLHRDFCAVYLIRGGRAIHRIDNEEFLMTRGDVYLLAPGATHSYQVSEILEVDAFYFLPELFSREQSEALRQSAGFWRLFRAAPDPLRFSETRWHLSPTQTQKLDRGIELILDQWLHPDALTPTILPALFFVMLAQLAQWRLRKTDSAVPQQSDNRLSDTVGSDAITDVISFCEAHLELELPVTQLAARAFLSPSRFTRLFQQHTGTSPAVFIRTLRLERAKALLLQTQCSTEEIARRCGFRDGAHLARTFRSVLNQSPTQWRNAANSRSRNPGRNKNAA